jgi:DNA-binding SARP family transcriptional activator/TolB-like protein
VPPSAALRLTAFGGLALSSDATLGSAATQRRPLAVLALVAAAGEAGVSRERIVGLLWPDAEPERGRRTLTQTLYSLRRATDVDDLFVGVTDVRLNPAAIACDVLGFAAALRQGRLQEAVAFYRGPFLDGFTLAGADEFERWVELERRRFAGQCADALRELGRRAERAGDGEAELAWRRRLVALDPLDSTATLALLDALGRAGDAAGAQRTVRIHEALVRDQLDLPLSPAVAARLGEILRASRAAVASSAAPAGPTPVEHVEVAPTSGAAPVPAVDAPPRPPTRRGRRHLLGLAGRAAGGLAVAAALVGLGVVVGRREAPAVARSAATATLPARRGTVAVLPFTLETADRSLEYLREGTAELLARVLSGELGPHAVVPGTVVAALDTAPPERVAPPAAARAHARTVGRRAGAAEVLVGRAAGTPERLTLHAALVDVATGVDRASAQVGGPADSLPALVDALAVGLLARRALGPDRADGFTGTRPSVLRAYLRAEAAYRRDRYQEALTHYEQALARDTGFAPAALGLALAADRLNSAEQHDRGLALAWAARDRLGARDRAYLLALAGPRYPDPSPAADLLAAWEHAVAITPDRAEAWRALGERFFYDGALLGVRDAEARAASALRRALALDPDDATARRHLIELAVRQGDLATLREIAAPAQRRAAGGGLADYLDWRVALALGDSAGLARARMRMPSFGVPSLRALALAAQHDGVALDDAARALRLLEARAALGSERLDVLLGEHSLALNRGRPVLALDVTERLQDAQLGARAHLRLRVLDALYAEGDTAAAAAAVRELAARTSGEAPAPDERTRAVALADACVLAQWNAAPWRVRGVQDLAPARRGATPRAPVATMRAAPLPQVVVPVAASPRACAELVDAMLAVRSRARDARSRVERLDALMLTGPALGDASAWATLAVARLYEALGDPGRALFVVRQRSYLKGWPRYLASSLQLEARLARAVGDVAASHAASQRYTAFHAAPEPALRARADSVGSARVIGRRPP